MNVFLRNLVSLLLLAALSVSTSFTYAALPDIRYRTIVYFFPEANLVDLKVLEKEFNSFETVEVLPVSAEEPIKSVSVIQDFKETYPVPDLSYLAYFGRGLDKQEASNIQQSNLAVIIDIAYPMLMTFDGLKMASQSIFDFAKITNGLIWDSATRELFTPDAWKLSRVDTWTENIPEVERHTVIHAYEDDQAVRAITLGMEKLGLPDVVVNDFSWSLSEPVGNLINLVTQSITEGLAPNGKGYLELNIDSLRDTPYKKHLISTLKENAEAAAKIEIAEGKWEEGDPENLIVELVFDSQKGESLSEKQQSFLSRLFGWEDQISYVKHNEAILEASECARKKLVGLKKDFNEGLNPGEYIQVKTPFLTPDGGTEWMWVEILSWDNKAIKGILKNEPFHIPDLESGSEVTVNQDDVFDYIRYFSDGRSEGNETSALIMKYQEQTRHMN